MKTFNREQTRDLPPIAPPMAEHFTAPCQLRQLHSAEDPHPVNVAVVHFPDGARNHWHRHEGGQVMHVLEGEGLVQTRGSAPVRLRPGDSVSADPGEEHWHGAAPGTSMTHLVVNVGATTWLEPTDPDQSKKV